MGYCGLADVKAVLRESSDAFDAEIITCIAPAEALVDSFLKREGLAVPSEVPQNVLDASANFAAWVFCTRRDPERAKAFFDAAGKFLRAYVAAETELPYVGSV